jgi:hypothetical protein
MHSPGIDELSVYTMFIISTSDGYAVVQTSLMVKLWQPIIQKLAAHQIIYSVLFDFVYQFWVASSPGFQALFSGGAEGLETRVVFVRMNCML